MWAAQFLTHKNLILSLPLAVRVPWGMVAGGYWGSSRGLQPLSLLSVMAGFQMTCEEPHDGSPITCQSKLLSLTAILVWFVNGKKSSMIDATPM